jgi:hypothetical protein
MYSRVEAARSIANARIVGLGASPDLTRDAMEFARRAAAAELVLPYPRLTADGEVMFYARRGNMYLDVGIHGDGTYSYYCRDAKGREASSDDDILISAGIAAGLVKVIKTIG